MFSEELGGNTTKRRQEEARARRRQLKQQQQKQAEQQKAHEAAIASIAATAPSSVIPPNASLALVDPTPILPTSSGAKPSAVANALQQRQIRAQAQQHRKAIVTIQSFYRACQSNRDLLTRQSTLLQQRLKDIGTLRDLLKQKANTDYIPPPATSTALVQQLIFLSKSIPYKRKADAPPLGVKFRDQSDPLKLSRLLQFVILPGIKSPDENVNPFFVWMQSRQGLARLESLLRLCLVAATMPHVDIKVLGSVTTFLQAVLVAQDSKTPFTIVQKYRSLLVSSSTPSPTAETKSTQKNKPQPHTKIGSNLDIICILRYHLLYCTGGPHPIPPASSKLRERCIPEKDRAQADALFQLVLQVTLSSSDTERSQLFLRFVSEIFTIPLLPWKISATSTSKLLAPVHNTNSMILIHMLETFVGHYGPVLSAGKIDSVLASDTSLTSCPATSSQSLLANLIQISRVSTKLNGSNISQLDFSATTRLFKFIATLVDAVPLGTFLSRESVVEWISDGMGHHSPVVLSPIVMEQCKLLLVDAFVRKLFTCAIDEQALNTEHVLLTKNEKDLKHEVDLQEAGQSASTLAAKEARVDRSRGFWNSSAWARKVTKGVSKMLSGESDSKPASSSSNAGKLINTSSVSRTLAESGGKGAASSSSALKVSRVSYTPDLLIALCRVYGIVLARMGGGGKEDIVKRARDVSLAKRDGKGVKKEMATATTDPCTQTLLNVVCFSTPLIRVLWGLIQSDSGIVSDLYAIIDPNKGRIPVRGLCIRPSYPSSKGKRLANDGDGDGAALLYVFICALSHVLIITDDTDIHDLERPIPLHQLRRCIQTLKKLLYRTCCLDDTENSDDNDSKGILQSNYFGLALVYAASRTMRDLYDRSSRRPFCVPKLWLVENLMENDIRRCKTHDQFVALLSAPVLKVSPFLVSFKRRLKIFERIVTTSRVEIQGENSQNPFNTNPLKPGIPVRITRGRILEDGLATLNNLGRNMRQRIAVQYHNEAGTRESGIDAGGLFKEFWTDLSAIAFNPNYALFRVTEGKLSRVGNSSFS
jgi:ubiquitin-protein ligase E3 C